MTVQTVPYALQNASHSAALFRQSASAPFVDAGALGSSELAVSQQGTPNMSVILGPGRAKVPGSSVSPPAGQLWTTQGMYDVLNDADQTLTIAASNPTNPRIDLVCIQVQDSFYSGASNQAVPLVVTGTPAPIPSVPATPVNAIAIATVAVGAGATTIVNANIARVISRARLIGGVPSVADLTALAALTGMSEPDQVWVDALNCPFVYDSGVWLQQGPATFTSTANRDTEYAKASAAYRVQGVQAKIVNATTKLTTMYEYFEAYNATTNLNGTSVAGVPTAGWYALASPSITFFANLNKSVPNATEYSFSGADFTERRDVRGWRDPSVNPSRIIPNEPGLYEVNSGMFWATSVSGGRILRLKKNGTSIGGNEGAAAASASGSVLQNASLRQVYMNGTTDYFEVGVFQNSGGALSITTDSFAEVTYMGAPVGP